MIAAMAYLTYAAPTRDRRTRSTSSHRRFNAQQGPPSAGELVVGQSGCLACHVIGDNGNNGPGPDLTHIGKTAARRADRLDTDQPHRADAFVPEPAEQSSEKF